MRDVFWQYNFRFCVKINSEQYDITGSYICQNKYKHLKQLSVTSKHYIPS